MEHQLDARVKTELMHRQCTREQLRETFVAGMVESLSLAFKLCVEDVIVFVNESVSGNTGGKTDIR